MMERDDILSDSRIELAGRMLDPFAGLSSLELASVEARSQGEQRCVKNMGGLNLGGLKSFYYLTVTPRTSDMPPWVICKSAGQMEALADALRNEIFVPLPPAPQGNVKSPRSPRALLGKASSPWDTGGAAYLNALCSVPGIGKCPSFLSFFTTNVNPPPMVEPFWRTGTRRTGTRRTGWLLKKKGDRTKLQRRFVVIKVVLPGGCARQRSYPRLPRARARSVEDAVLL